MAGLVLLSGCASSGPPRVDGVVWQPDAATSRPHGSWDRLGARQLMIQWTVVDGVAFIDGTEYPTVQPAPDWARIVQEPWAGSVLMGLAGRFNEPAARRDLDQLAAASERLAAIRSPFNVAGWYFPVEADPTWPGVARMADALARLPRPLWISVYDKGNIGPKAFADWIQSWVPADVGVLFQDGVGEYVRSAATAQAYADEIARRRGAERTAVIVEAFRPQPGGGFRAATADELRNQIKAYRGHRLYLFDGPHYVPDSTVDALVGPKAP